MLNEKNYKYFLALALYSGENMTAKEVGKILAERGIKTIHGNNYDKSKIRDFKKLAAAEIEQQAKKYY